ncbi:MAG: hypothetical protein IJ518_02280 [Clostridia bacterium]|nr:hypothetical protein [Clostridia bacterium]
MFDTTKRILSKIGRYVSVDSVSVEQTTDYCGNPVELITISKDVNVGFEAAEESVIFYFFSDHVHFDDFSVELEGDEPNFLARAESFVDDLFTLPIHRRYSRKGTRVVSDQSWFVQKSGKEESIAGVTLCGPGWKNLFKPKERFDELWQFNADTKQWQRIR